MSGRGGESALERALQLSLELRAAAESGELRTMPDLDAERLRLLHSARLKSGSMDGNERTMLHKIMELNDQAIGFLEHRRRRTERCMDLAATGRRALAAYGSHG
jgi:hypothetical protein